jgi:hypothetical protein
LGLAERQKWNELVLDHRPQSAGDLAAFGQRFLASGFYDLEQIFVRCKNRCREHFCGKNHRVQGGTESYRAAEEPVKFCLVGVTGSRYKSAGFHRRSHAWAHGSTGSSNLREQSLHPHLQERAVAFGDGRITLWQRTQHFSVRLPVVLPSGCNQAAGGPDVCSSTRKRVGWRSETRRTPSRQ